MTVGLEQSGVTAELAEPDADEQQRHVSDGDRGNHGPLRALDAGWIRPSA